MEKQFLYFQSSGLACVLFTYCKWLVMSVQFLVLVLDLIILASFLWVLCTRITEQIFSATLQSNSELFCHQWKVLLFRTLCILFHGIIIEVVNSQSLKSRSIVYQQVISNPLLKHIQKVHSLLLICSNDYLKFSLLLYTNSNQVSWIL